MYGSVFVCEGQAEVIRVQLQQNTTCEVLRGCWLCPFSPVKQLHRMVSRITGLYPPSSCLQKLF